MATDCFLTLRGLDQLTRSNHNLPFFNNQLPINTKGRFQQNSFNRLNHFALDFGRLILPERDMNGAQDNHLPVAVQESMAHANACFILTSKSLEEKTFNKARRYGSRILLLQNANGGFFIFVADEETGSDYGIQYLLENHMELFKKEDFFLIPDAGNEDGTLVEVAEKSIVWFKFNIQGKQTHGSTPELGVNAHKAGANLIVELEDLYKVFNDSDPVFDPPISTFEPTKREANVPNVNTIPGEDVFYYDCRLLPNYNVDDLWKTVKEISKKVEEKHGVSIKVSSPQELRAAPPTPVDAPVVKAVQNAISELRDIETKPMGIGGGTVAAFFREAGFNSVVWATQDETLHEPNEYVKIDNILDDAKVFAHVALQD